MGSASLAKWLKRHYTRDVLIPLVPGEKRPKFPHKGGTWSWSQYDAFRARWGAGEQDVGILLYHLCVVDVDCEALALELEASHAVLSTVPCARTRKGRHYYFERSALADAGGYFDGRAQRVAKVDFKTRASGGTSGLIVAAPSEGKDWIREPWTTHPHGELPVIPDALLEAVAAPRGTVARAQEPQVLIYFPDSCDGGGGGGGSNRGGLYVRPTPHLRRMRYFDMFLGDEGAGGEAHPSVPVPLFTEAEFRAVLDACAGRLVALRTGGRAQAFEAFEACDAFEAHVGRVRALADFLGVPARVGTTIEASLRVLPTLRACPDWAKAWAPAWGATASPPLVAVDAALAGGLRFERLAALGPHDPRWLRHELPRCSADVADGAPVLEADPAASALSRLPGGVVDVLRAFAGRLALAGGGALGAVAHAGLGIPPGADLDLFVYGVGVDAANAIVDAIAARPDVTAAARTANAVTFRFRPEGCEKDEEDKGHCRDEDAIVAQVVLRLSADPAAIVSGFDLAPTKVLVLFDAADGAPRVLAHPSWVSAMRHLAFPVDEATSWSRATALRVFKYIAKGFDAAVPQLVDRGALAASVRTCRHSDLSDMDGASLLLGLETVLREEGRVASIVRTAPGPTAQSLRQHLPRVARWLRSQQRSDYMTALSLSGALVRAVLAAVRRGAAWVLGRPPAAPNAPVWRAIGAPGQFHTTDFAFEAALVQADA
jgi:hypothetical protein